MMEKVVFSYNGKFCCLENIGQKYIPSILLFDYTSS